MATSMDPTLSINKLSNARVLGGPQTVGAIYGEPVASEVTAVEATFLDGSAIRDDVNDGYFAFILADNKKVEQLCALGPNDQVLDCFSPSNT